jgi:tetratricopeptide (TPR) repeat protein
MTDESTLTAQRADPSACAAARALLRRAAQEKALGMFDCALDDLRTAAFLDPANADIPAMSGQVWLSHRCPHNAAGAFTRALAMRPDDADLYLGRGTAYAALGERGKAADDFARALSLRLGSPGAFWGLRAVCRAEEADYRELAALTAALEHDPKEVAALVHRAITLLRMGERDRAAEDLKAALRVEPGCERARQMLQELGRPTGHA